MSQSDSKYECVMNRPTGPSVTHNNVHTLKNRAGDRGLEIKCNWRYWGASISWGDTNIYYRGSDLEGKICVAWFVGFQVGPLFFVYGWPKRS